MDVTIIGTGNMARGIGTRLVAGGHAVSLVGQELDQAEALAAELSASATNRGPVVTVSDQPAGDVNVLAVPWAAAVPIVEQYRAQLAGRVLIDITNPIMDFSTLESAVAPGSSAAEELAKVVPAGTRVVKAFNTTFAGTLVAGGVAGQVLDVFIAGDDQEAKTTVTQLVRDGGLNPVDVGGLSRARNLEMIGLLGIALQFGLGTNFQTGWKLLMPQSA